MHVVPNPRVPLVAAQNAPPIPFPFGVEFQAQIVKLMLLDSGIDETALEFVKPEYLETPALQWVLHQIIGFRKTYNSVPSISTLHELTKQLDPQIRPGYSQAIDHLRDLVVKEEGWIKHAFLDWVKRNVFVRAHQETRGLFNAGKIGEAYDYMKNAMLQIEKTEWTKPDRSWFFEELPTRDGRRSKPELHVQKIGTGIVDLDLKLGGGFSPGELALWLAYAKGGKSTMLITHGVTCTRHFMKKCLHIVLEGSRRLVEDRYDAAFTAELYTELKKGEMSDSRYNITFKEYQKMSQLLVVRAFLDTWDNTILSVEEEMRTLRRQFSWVPDEIIIDYGDLLQGRNGPYTQPWHSDRDVYRDMKTLANRGFVVLTASQVQRPKVKDYLNTEHWLTSADIAGGIEKIRVADFVGSINSTKAERKAGMMRLLPELYRDGALGDEIKCKADYARMLYGGKFDDPTVQKVGDYNVNALGGVELKTKPEDVLDAVKGKGKGKGKGGKGGKVK